MTLGIGKLLREPSMTGHPGLDRPETTDLLHREILRRKPFLRNLYREYYLRFRDSLPSPVPARRPILIELGSGGGFLKEVVPYTLTSDVMALSGLDVRMSGLALPLKSESVDAFFLLDTFHHIPRVRDFLAEADRCLKPGGRIVMMEPANTWWGRLIFRNFHHEPFLPESGWEFASTGPMSSANGALPWIVLSRDRERFEKEFPRLRVRCFQPHTPFRYLLSGGFSLRQLAPSAGFRWITRVERMLRPLFPWIGMFYWIEIEKERAAP